MKKIKILSLVLIFGLGFINCQKDSKYYKAEMEKIDKMIKDNVRRMDTMKELKQKALSREIASEMDDKLNQLKKIDRTYKDKYAEARKKWVEAHDSEHNRKNK